MIFNFTLQFFHGENCYANASEYYVMHTLYYSHHLNNGQCIHWVTGNIVQWMV